MPDLKGSNSYKNMKKSLILESSQKWSIVFVKMHLNSDIKIFTILRNVLLTQQLK